MDKQNMIYTYNELSFNLKKEGNSDIGYVMLNEIIQSQKDKYCVTPLT